MINLKALLPSQAKEQLTTLFYEKLCAAPLNWFADPSFNYADALHVVGDIDDAQDIGTWNRCLTHECFQAALAKFEAAYPKKWDNARQEAYRDNQPPRTPE